MREEEREIFMENCTILQYPKLRKETREDSKRREVQDIWREKNDEKEERVEQKICKKNREKNE